MTQQPRPTYRPDRPAASIGRVWIGVFLAAALLYAITCQRGPAWQDSGIRMWQIANGDLTGSMGLALAHPGYILAGQLCRLVPKAHVATAINAFSGIGMAVALANLAAIIVLLTRRRWIGILIAATLAVAHTPWWLATIAETYTWSLAGFTAELWLLTLLIRHPSRRYLLGLALVNGLGLCIHNFALLPIPVYAAVAVWLVRRKQIPASAIALAVGCWLIGAGFYIALTVGEVITTGSLATGLQSALFGRFAGEVFNVSAPPRLLENAAMAGLNGINVLLPLAVVGWWRLRRWAGGPLAMALGATTVIHLLFVVRYSVQDQFTFLLPALAMIALAAGVGAASLSALSSRWRGAVVAACGLSILAGPIFYASAPSLAKRFGPARRWAQRSRHRDELRYFLVPWKHNETSAEVFARTALAQAEGGVILADGKSKYPLLMVRWQEGLEQTVAIQHNRHPLPHFDPDDADAYWSALGDRPLFAVSDSAEVVSSALREAVRITEPAEHEVLYRLD